VLPLRHARSVPLGEEIRGWRRVSFVVATGDTEGERTLFRWAGKDIPMKFLPSGSERSSQEGRFFSREGSAADCGALIWGFGGPLAALLEEFEAHGGPAQKKSANRRLARGPESCHEQT